MAGSINTVFFDAAGTLFGVKGSVAAIYLAYAERYGFRRTEASLDLIAAAFARAFADAPPPIFVVTDQADIKQSERLWWFDVVHNVFYRVGIFERFDEFFDAVFAAFDGPDCWDLYPDTIPALQQLKDQGYELGIISNFDTRLFNVLRGLGLTEFFDTVTVSSLSRSVKPAPKIFAQALEKHAIDPEEAVHVGDSLKEDVEGATRSCLAAVWVNRDGRTITGQANTVQTIKDLSELAAVLSRL